MEFATSVNIGFGPIRRGAPKDPQRSKNPGENAPGSGGSLRSAGYPESGIQECIQQPRAG
jgi:hypothetical protein